MDLRHCGQRALAKEEVEMLLHLQEVSQME
jgi:hypothetical protein